jgi:hypothetical protein
VRISINKLYSRLKLRSDSKYISRLLTNKRAVHMISKRLSFIIFSMSEEEFRKILETIDTEKIRLQVFDLYEVPTEYMDSNLTLRKIYF